MLVFLCCWLVKDNKILNNLKLVYPKPDKRLFTKIVSFFYGTADNRGVNNLSAFLVNLKEGSI